MLINQSFPSPLVVALSWYVLVIYVDRTANSWNTTRRSIQENPTEKPYTTSVNFAPEALDFDILIFVRSSL